MGSATMKVYAAYIAVILAHFALLSLMSAATTGSIDMSTAILIRVEQSGKGDFKKIQDAIDSVPSNNSELVFIWVKPGTYRFELKC
jgi:pectinesterase/laccase